MADPERYLLTDEEREIAKAWNNKVFAKRGCPACGARKFALSSFVTEIRSASFGEYLTGTFQWTPSVMVDCKECGYLMFFDAKKVGINRYFGDPVEKTTAEEKGITTDG